MGCLSLSTWQRLQRWFQLIYLLSAAIILTTTGLGKLPSVLSTDLTLCMERSIDDFPWAPFASNQGVEAFAAGAELGIVVLICLCPIRWLPCFASAIWGMICLSVRFLFMSPALPGDGTPACNCLGAVDAPPIVASSIALWLAIGGTIAGSIGLCLAAARTVAAWKNRKARKSEPIGCLSHNEWLKMVGGFLLLLGASAAFYWGFMNIRFDPFTNLKPGWNDFRIPLILAMCPIPAMALGLAAAIRGVAWARGSCYSPVLLLHNFVAHK